MIKIIENAVWSESGVSLSYKDLGPASRVGENGKYSENTITLTIDDLVKDTIKEGVNFIKMDIEGAEVPALEGARETIRTYGPKLAIAAYHKADDLFVIPSLIMDIRDDYSFYLDYFTPVGYEAILFCIPNGMAQKSAI